jgi:hypothetical protein
VLSGGDIGARFRAHVQQRIAVAKRLNEDECGGSYAEAMLILSSVLSGVATDLWPGEGKDRKRFVELWAKYADMALRPNLVSVPLLLNHLHDSGEENLAQKVRATRPEAHYLPDKPSMQIVTGKHVDQSEAVLSSLDPRLTAKKLRSYSYGNLFYKHVRSGYTHEGHPTDFASRYPMAEEPAPISYVNIVRYVDNEIRSRRLIYFSAVWVADLVESVSNSAEPLLHSLPLQEPKSWWIDG